MGVRGREGYGCYSMLEVNEEKDDEKSGKTVGLDYERMRIQCDPVFN